MDRRDGYHPDHPITCRQVKLLRLAVGILLTVDRPLADLFGSDPNPPTNRSSAVARTEPGCSMSFLRRAFKPHQLTLGRAEETPRRRTKTKASLQLPLGLMCWGQFGGPPAFLSESSVSDGSLLRPILQIRPLLQTCQVRAPPGSQAVSVRKQKACQYAWTHLGGPVLPWAHASPIPPSPDISQLGHG